MIRPRLSNADARRRFIARHGLSAPPTPRLGPGGLTAAIEGLGFVQIDSIRTVERAHHMILFARNQTYRPAALTQAVERDRALFENWTHDAAIIPTAFFPYWRPAFDRRAARLAENWRRWGREGFDAMAGRVLDEIARRGPVSARALAGDEARPSTGWWDWSPTKTTLEWLWRTGRLCVARREGFEKIYDLTENVLPEHARAAAPDHGQMVDWACAAALDRLGFATTGEIAAFWALATPAEAKDWAAGRGDLVEIEVEAAAGEKPWRALARPGLLDEAPPPPPARVRALSPFDPLIRDRRRLRRLFGFDYTIEVFVPAAKRKWGYYVFPLLEGARFIGRVDMKADRAAGALTVAALWLEPGVRPAKGRLAAIEAELDRQRRFANLDRVVYAEGWRRW